MICLLWLATSVLLVAAQNIARACGSGNVDLFDYITNMTATCGARVLLFAIEFTLLASLLNIYRQRGHCWDILVSL